MKINLKLNEIKLIPHQYKRLLSKDKSSARPLLTVKNTLFFAFCVVEEVYLVVASDWNCCVKRLFVCAQQSTSLIVHIMIRRIPQK